MNLNIDPAHSDLADIRRAFGEHSRAAQALYANIGRLAKAATGGPLPAACSPLKAVQLIYGELRKARREAKVLRAELEKRVGSTDIALRFAHAGALESHNALLAKHNRASADAIIALISGIERWASDEDGIPDEIWDAYVAARTLLGEDAPEPAGQSTRPIGYMGDIAGPGCDPMTP